MTEVSQQAAHYLEDVFEATGLQLRVSVKQGVAGEVLDIEGKDAELLQAQTGELLEALQHLINQVFGRSLAGGARLVCDVNGFRATREAELQAMANLAANRVRQTGVAFTFEPMSANERRIIHLTLADSPDLSTESIGEGSERKLRIVRKSSSPRNS
ncbi:MAG TPA: R3H domain-containing nucleic acid-binding protein [Pyrinomonadaceae bacterium]|jgi:spoIIIJ-associated protein|nr:R3H domain-containing nucleic acid-binding protein [Pyrinomonadaceae bacterium]